jgi:hypothetical protein
LLNQRQATFVHKEEHLQMQITPIKLFIVLFAFGFSSCGTSDKPKSDEKRITAYWDSLEAVKKMHKDSIKKQESEWRRVSNPDTIISKSDTLIGITTKDTVYKETGIFSYLVYNFPSYLPEKLVDYARKACQFEKVGDRKSAKVYFEKIIDYKRTNRQEDLKYEDDMNFIYQYDDNTSILYSYAYEKLDKLDSAIGILKPLLKNPEVWGCKIQERYVQLCIKKYGKARVKHELDNCGMTIQLLNDGGYYGSSWIVKIFGANVGFYTYFDDPHTPKQAQHSVNKSRYYKLVQ